jgi:ABC-type taurine transport system substrate-binding protein
LRLLARLVVAAALALAHAAVAMAEPIHVGYTAVGDFFPLFIAKEEGFFAKRGLDVEPVLVPLNPIIPQALMANSLQIGGATPSIFLQAVDGGIDLVAIAGDTVTGPAVYQNSGVIARPDSNITRPEDFIGKTVGVPGIGAFMHVLFRHWLASKGVDDKQVTFVEVAFFNMSDALRGRSVDAVLTGQPVLSRIVEGRHRSGRVPLYRRSAARAERPSLRLDARVGGAECDGGQSLQGGDRRSQSIRPEPPRQDTGPCQQIYKNAVAADTEGGNRRHTAGNWRGPACLVGRYHAQE